MIRAGMLIGAGALVASAAALTAGAALSLRRRGMTLRGKVVLITGGSHGLGFALARGFARQGASLSLCARSEEELAAANDALRRSGAEAFTVRADIGEREQAEHAVAETVRHYGRIDVLVNNAGLIQVAPLETLTIQDFEQAMKVMFWGVVYTTFAALPHLRKRASGRIVNVTSVGAKVSVPHLLPYSCAKFAAGAFSEGLRSELSGSGIKVVTIAPGLMRTGSYFNAKFKGNAEGEAAWFGVASSMPGVTMSAARAARQIIAATRSGRAEKILTTQANLLALLHGVFPGLTADLLGLVNRVLPKGGDVTGETGAESEILQKGWMRTLMLPGRRAAEKLLQPAMREREPVSA